MTTPAYTDSTARLDYLDAARAFALLLGVVFHASLSFTPYFMGWAVQDISTGAIVADFMLVSHSFRMELFFLLAGFFSQGLLARKGMRSFVGSRLVRLGIPFLLGWFLLRPLIVSGWIMGAASMRGDYAFWASISAGFGSLKTLPAGLLTGTHLWFLYYLLIVTALVVLLRAIIIFATQSLAGETGVKSVYAKLDAIISWLGGSGWGLPLMVLPTAYAIWHMRFWGMDTPDQSLRLHWAVLAVYGGFFLVGWMFGRKPNAIAIFGRITVMRFLLLTIGSVAVLKLSGIQADPGHDHFKIAHVGFVLGYATLMWTLVALALGIFYKICPTPRPVIRYISDSSYWMYLVHLPIVVWLQVAVAEVALHWTIKLTFVSAATITLALLSYDLFVRSTLLGQILNGRRRDRVLFPRGLRKPS